MRWLVLFAVLGSASAVAAPRIERADEPPERAACPSVYSWAVMQRCIERTAPVTVLQDLQQAKLVFSIDDDGYLLDAGRSDTIWVTLDDVTTRPALLRRRFMTTCHAGGSRISLMTSCELLVHGKARAWFRGTFERTEAGLPGVRADMRHAGSHCAMRTELLIE